MNDLRPAAIPAPSESLARVCDCQALDAAMAAGEDTLPLFREVLQQGTQVIGELARQGAASAELVYARAWLVDELLARAWRQILQDHGTGLSLVAVGGYGRAELLPGSDIDVLILLPDRHPQTLIPLIESFLAFLWDIGLEVGHSVRTIAECVTQGERDITVITNLIEARLLAGSPTLYTRMRTATATDRIWPSAQFLDAKLHEQARRYHKFHDTGYKLEPNIKESPGGLRDIQTIGWIARRHFGTTSLHELIERGLLTEGEYHTLMEGQSFLWRVRFTLHTLTGRREDRLLFDYQQALADSLGYREEEGQSLAVERFMKDYFRTVMELERLNEMLLQLFKEAILYADEAAEPERINTRFQSRRGFIEVTNTRVFARYPFALMEIFLLLAERPELSGVRASTIRLIRDHRHLIDDDYRNDLRARSIFMEIVRQRHGVTHELRRMNRYGVLAAYLPAFGQIVGQMQYDLFHIYTVDEHTLFVIRNLRRFAVPHYADELPLCSELIQTIPKPELLILAALFHDIAKGRRGDHSQLGAKDAEKFCRHHGLSRHDTALVAWLVRDHLLMSSTAQRRDISDPNVILDFARAVTSRERLTYLYLLTVADIRGTNPELWNSWKNALLLELYTATAQALRRGLQNPREQAEQLRENKQTARARLVAAGYTGAELAGLWREFSNEYFLRHTPDEIEWHIRCLAEHGGLSATLVSLRNNWKRGETELFIFTPGSDLLFERTTALLGQLGISVVDARIINTPSGYALSTYGLLDEDGSPIEAGYHSDEVVARLREGLKDPDAGISPVTRQPPRHFRHFRIPTDVSFEPDEPNERTILQLITADRPGLLSVVARVFTECGVILQNARISTFGVRAEDVFYITDRRNQPLRDRHQFDCLKEQLRRQLDA